MRTGAGEINHGLARGAINADGDFQRRTIINARFKMAIGEFFQNAAHAFFGIIHDVPHIGADSGKPVFGNGAAQFLHAFFIGSDLRLDVSNIHIRAARGVTRAGQQGTKFRFAEMPTIHQQEIINHHAFFFQRARQWRRGTRREAANISVMPA